MGREEPVRIYHHYPALSAKARSYQSLSCARYSQFSRQIIRQTVIVVLDRRGNMKTQRFDTFNFSFLPILFLAFMVAFQASAAFAHDPDSVGALPDNAYRRIAALASTLDERATHAAEHITEDEAYRGNKSLIDAVQHFAHQVHHFHQQVDSYHTQAWQIDEGAEHLREDAGAVQQQMQRRGAPDEHALIDWERTLDELNEIAQVYRNRSYDDREREGPHRFDRRRDR